MRSALTLALVLVAAVPASAMAAGPVLSGGVIRTELLNNSDQRYEGLKGGGYKVAFEIGSHHIRNEFGFDQSFLSGDGEGASHKLTLTGLSYQLSALIFQQGFTPYFAGGVEFGLAQMKEWGYADQGVSSASSNGYYIRPYVAAGLRIPIGRFAIKTEVVAGWYGSFYGLSTNATLSYTW